MKIDYKYIISLLIVLFIIIYFFKYYNKEPMSSSVIGKDLTGKDFDITINNYPHIDLLRDKQVSYYRKLNQEQQKKFDVILQEEKDKLQNIIEKKKQDYLVIKKDLSDKVSGFKIAMEKASNTAEKKQLEMQKLLAEKELEFQKEKESMELDNIKNKKLLEQRLRSKFDEELKLKSDEIDKKISEVNKLTDESDRLSKSQGKLNADLTSYKKLADERLKENEKLAKKCKDDRKQYITDHTRKMNDMKTSLQNEHNRNQTNLKNSWKTSYDILNSNWKTVYYRDKNSWKTKYDNLNRSYKTNNEWKAKHDNLDKSWKTKYDNLNSEWNTKYNNKPCNPVNYCSLATAQTVVNNYNAKNRRRRRRRRRRRWSDLHFKYDIKQIGFSPSGIPIVRFKYNDLVPDLTPHVTYEGVLAQQLLPLGFSDDVVILEDNGFYSVDYDMIDVEFKQV